MSALITNEQRFLLLANGRESLQNLDFDSMLVVKLFTLASGENSACRSSAIRTLARRKTLERLRARCTASRAGVA